MAKNLLRGALSLAAGIFFCIFASLLLRLLNVPETPFFEGITPVAENDDNVYAVLLTVLVSPVFEEFVFRRLLYGLLKPRMKAWLAVLITTVVFAIFHLSPALMVYAFLISILLCKDVDFTGSWIFAAILHFGANGTAWLINRDPSVYAFFLQNGIVFCILSAVGLAGMVTLLIRFRKKA